MKQYTKTGICLAAVCVAQFASAQSYPSKPVRVLTSFPPGAMVETVTRQINQEIMKSWTQPVVVENRPGGNGIISAEACVRAAPDGHTLCLVDRTLPLLPYLNVKLPFDPERDLLPVTNLFATVLALVTHPSVGAGNLKELLAAAKARPGALNYGSLGPATTSNILMEWLKSENGLTMTHVPYKSPPTLIQDLLAGVTHMTTMGLGSFTAFHSAGKLKIIAVTGDKRSPLVPNIPTLREQGLSSIDMRIPVWFGLFAPAGTPREALNRVHQEVARTYALPGFREKVLEANAFEAIGNSPDEFAQFVKADRAAGAEQIRVSGAKLD